MMETGRPLSGKLEAMNDKQIVLRVPAALVERARKLEPRIAADPLLTSAGNTRINRSAVFRMALVLGLEALEQRYPEKKTKR